MIHVIATIEVLNGNRNQLLALFKDLAPTVRKEQGCIEYDTAVDLAPDVAGVAPERANIVTVVEKWESPAALDAHLKAPHMAAFREQAGPLLASVEIRVLQPA
jgi:quinol monooxygenase YgiN